MTNTSTHPAMHRRQTLLRRFSIAGMGALAVLSGMVLRRDAQAAEEQPKVYCAPGATPTCFAVHIAAAPDGNGGTDVTVRLSNLQGASDYPVTLPGAGPAWARLHRVDIIGPDDGSFAADGYMTGVDLSLTGGAAAGGDVNQTWGVVPLEIDPGIARGYALGTDIAMSGAEIIGCAEPPDLGYPYIRTCATGGQRPEVVLSFAANGAWTAQQVRLALVFQDPTGEWGCEVSEVPRLDDDDPFSCVRIGAPQPVPSAQSISFTSTVPSQAYVGDSYSVRATATSGLVVSFTSLTHSTCSVGGSTVSFDAAGTCIVAADQPGDASYLAAPRVTQAITITLPIVIATMNVQPGHVSLSRTAMLNVVLLSRHDFDARRISLANTRLVANGGTPVAPARRGTSHVTSVRDVNGDGRPDRLVSFAISALKVAGLVAGTPDLVLRDDVSAVHWQARDATPPVVVP